MNDSLWLVSLGIECSLLDCEYSKEYPMFAVYARNENKYELDSWWEYLNHLLTEVLDNDVSLPETVGEYCLDIHIDDLPLINVDDIKSVNINNVAGIDATDFDDEK